MKPTIILDSIRNAGLILSLLPGDLLKVEPKEKITDEIRQAIKEHKQEIVRLLSEGSEGVRTDVTPAPGEWRQVNCQAFEHNGVMMATTPESCRQWQGTYCQGCTLSTIQ